MESGQTTGADRDAGLAQVGTVMLSYEEFGEPSDPTLLLVMGLGMQMLGWDEELCGMLAERGHHVVRFDNRDCGLSSKVEGRRVNLTAGMVGFTGSAPYTLYDMAADTIGLLDHLGVERAHLVGASMGGMIAQALAARHPERAASLCSIMASTGQRKLSTMPRLGVLGTLLTPVASSREDFLDSTVEVFAKIGSPDFPPDVDRLRQRAARSYDRAYYPAGTARQLMAILDTGDRSKELHRITAPTLVIHGAADSLVPPQAGRDVAAAIPGARLELIDGMGHDLPPELWPRFVELIGDHVAAAEARTG